MSAIFGYIDLKKKINKDKLHQMNDALDHRGKKYVIYKNEEEYIALANRYNQSDNKENINTFINFQEKIIIHFNGKIDNANPIKTELLNSFQFEKHTDAELLLAIYSIWGIEGFKKLKGMFAISIYDKNKHKLWLIRDHFGIKPLYYFINEYQCLFASELKAIIHSGLVAKEIDYASLSDFFVYRYIPSPKTIWKYIYKIPPAHYAVIDLSDLSISVDAYWKLDLNEKKIKNTENSIEKVGEYLTNAVQNKLKNNAENVASFLSGGYDSSAIVNYMKKSGYLPETFSIGFSQWEKSEDQFAKIVAEHLGVENTAIIADEKSLSLIDLMPEVYDEPIADISIIPTYMVSNLASKKTNAALSGEGADELFGGYNWQRDFYNYSYPTSLKDKIKKLLKKQDTVDFYAKSMAMGWFDKTELKSLFHPRLHTFIPEDVHWFYRKHFDRHASPLKSIQKMDIRCFMGELVITKVERASMANNLEVSMPFLDYELFEYVFSLNEKDYIDKKQTKILLYEQIKNDLPESILNRNKQGFVGPDAYYMNIEWYKEHLKDSQLVRDKIINQSFLDDLYKEDYNWQLWKILVFEKWYQYWMYNE